MRDKPDANKKAIVSYLRRCGCVVKNMPRTEGFDAVVIAWNGVHIVEIKNVAGKNKLTEAEERCKAEVESTGQVYNIIRTIDEAARMIGKG